MITDARSSRNANESNREPSVAPSHVWHEGVEIKSEPTESPLDEGHGDKDRRLPPSPCHRSDLCPEPGVGPDGKVKRRRVESELGDQSVCVAPGSETSGKSPVPHADFLSMIQISNVMSLVSSGDDFLPAMEEAATSTGKGSEPEGSSPSSGSTGQGVAPHKEAGGNSRLIWRNVDKLTDKLSWHSWVQRWLRNCRHVRQKWPNSGRRRAVCLLCGRRFGRNSALDQHMALVHCESFQYRCGSCNRSFKAWACLCRHILQAHSVKIQRRSRSSPVAKTRKCVLKAKQVDVQKAECINSVKDASFGDGALHRLIKAGRPCRTYARAAVTKVPLRDDERCDDKARVVRLESLLSQRTAELAAERHRVESLLAEKETLLAEKDAEIVSLKADLAAMTVDNDNLRQENERLRETSHLESQRGGLDILPEMRAGFRELQVAIREQRTHRNVSPTPAPESSSSEAPMSPLALSATHDSIQSPRNHTDVSLRDVGPKDYARLHQQSFGQVGRFGCLLFRKIISEENYKAWSRTTNWDGSRGKEELPQNVKDFVVETLKREFPEMNRRDLKDCIDKINEFLRTPRKSSQGLTLL